jgi:two-component system cell cycle sensor histidine kinase PleC
MIQNKYIIRFSFIGLFINIVANIVLYRYFIIEEVILKQISSQNTYLAETYKSSIWENNTNAVTKIKNKGYQNLLQDKDFIVFSKASANFLKNTNAEVIIYDQFGQKFFANHEIMIVDIDEYNSESYYDKFFFQLDRYFLQNYISNFPVPEALKGKTAHSLVSRAIILDKYGKYYERSFINSYIPIINSSIGQFSVEGVLQITIDITPQWDNINFIEKRIFITFIVVFLVFFIIIMYNPRKSSRSG